jgi:hypothetical protein
MKKDFLRLLKALDEDELREELKGLYERFPILREYYKLELSGNTKAVLDKYKTDVRKAFFTGRRRMGKRSRSNSAKVIKDFKEVSIHAKDLIELHFHRVAVMVEAIDYYMIDNEPFYNSMIKSFEHAAEMAKKELLLDSFREMANEIVTQFEVYDSYGNDQDLRRRFQAYFE